MAKLVDLSIIPVEEWRCPKCHAGGKTGDFFVESSNDIMSEEVYEDDYAVCMICGGNWKVKSILAKWRAKETMVNVHVVKVQVG